MVVHRTDCITCGSWIYHPPLTGVGAGFSSGEIQFYGLRPDKGNVYFHGPSDHHILTSFDGEFVVATCTDYWSIHKAFDTLERIIAGTRHDAPRRGDPPF